MKTHFSLTALTLVFLLFFAGCQKEAPVNQKLQLKDFNIKSSVVVDEDGETISKTDYAPKEWHSTQIPSTALNALVENGIYPDPYTGMNNMKIPDVNEEFNEENNLKQYSHLPDNQNPWRNPYWYRTSFNVPESYSNQVINLHFDGINYRADVWLNGEQIADSSEMVGMFRRFRHEVSDVIKPGEKNTLAVKIYTLDYPAKPSPPQTEALGPFYINGGPSGAIGKNVSMQCTAGWDWIPGVRDRNMGIWQDVYLKASGPVTIKDPHFITDLPLPETSPAELTLKTILSNHDDEEVTGELTARVSPANFNGESFTVSKSVSIDAGNTDEITLYPETYDKLTMENPKLWWPNTYGEQNLYKVTYTFTSGETISDKKAEKFGVREISSEVTEVDGDHRRDFFINGKKIQIEGGSWVPDMMLNRDSTKFYNELRLYKEGDMNMVRIWGGGVKPPEVLYEICDELGLLVWQDFWITGGANNPKWDKGTWDWPLSSELFISSAKDMVKQLRNHPSLIIWCGGNETYPRQELHSALRNDVIPGLDSSRYYLPASGFGDPPKSWGLTWPDNKSIGTYSGKPYHWVNEKFYYDRVKDGKRWLFPNEGGFPSVPTINSVEKFIPDLEPDSGEVFPLNDTWGYHDACEGNGKYSIYHNAISNRYGEVTGVDNYVYKAQLVNANSFRSIFEAMNHKLDRTAGLVTWKTAPAWPSVIWQLYDYYLRPHAGYYYAKRAVGPINIQLDRDDHEVTVVNTQLQDHEDLTAYARIYDPQMEILDRKESSVSVTENTSKVAFSINDVFDNEKSMYFVKLNLKDDSGNVVSENFYWIFPPSKLENLRGQNQACEACGFTYNQDISFAPYLQKLPQTEIETLVKSLNYENGEYTAKIEISPDSSNLAFFTHVSVLKGKQGEEVLPSYWSDNYVTVLPGENKTLTVNFNEEDLGNNDPYLVIEGWNSQPMEINLEENEIENPAIEYSDLTLDTSSEAGNGLNGSIAIENTNSEGSRTTMVPVYVKIDGDIHTSFRTGVKPGQKETVTFTLKDVEPGTHNITVGDIEKSDIEVSAGQ